MLRHLLDIIAYVKAVLQAKIVTNVMIYIYRETHPKQMPHIDLENESNIIIVDPHESNTFVYL